MNFETMQLVIPYISNMTLYDNRDLKKAIFERGMLKNIFLLQINGVYFLLPSAPPPPYYTSMPFYVDFGFRPILFSCIGTSQFPQLSKVCITQLQMCIAPVFLAHTWTPIYLWWSLFHLGQIFRVDLLLPSSKTLLICRFVSKLYISDPLRPKCV